MLVGPRERHQREPGALRQAYRERRRCRQRDQQRDPDGGALLHHLVARAAGDQHITRREIRVRARQRSDGLVERIVPADILTHHFDPLSRDDPRRRVHAAGARIDRLPARQLPDRGVQIGRRDAHPRTHGCALADGIRGALRPAHAAAGATREVAGARSCLRLRAGLGAARSACARFCHASFWLTSTTSTAVTLYSGQLVAQSEFSVVTTLALVSGKWNVVYTTPGAIFSETLARSTVSPARLVSPTQSPSLMPRTSASCGWISSTSSVCHRTLLVRRVCAPTLYCVRIRPVVRISGKRLVERSLVGTYSVGQNLPLPCNDAAPEGTPAARSSRSSCRRRSA